MTTAETCRLPAVAGTFYPGTEETLRKELGAFFSSLEGRTAGGTVRGLVVPHAGYLYSGSTAAHAYQLLRGTKYDAVVIVGPSHRDYFDKISIYPGDSFSTPLGTVPIQQELREELLRYSPEIVASAAGHRTEHSVEVQLPFLQTVLKDFSFLPIVIGNQSASLCTLLGKALAQIGKGRNLLFVASSDLSHYHPYKEAVALDKHVLDAIEAFDPVAWLTKFETEDLEACGGGAIAAVMSASKQLGATKAEILHYCNSGDTSGDTSGVVGYLAAAFVQES
jgi:AmmeMemoRadiSam system protein B